MNELQKIFKYSDIEVRIITKNGEPWFVAKDVCEILDIKNSRDALTRISDKNKGVAKTDTLGGIQEISIVNEPGLYKLIFTSNKEEAEKFQDWVYEEVLPSIRKTGKYETPNFLAKMHDSMGEIRALGWHATPTVRKQHVNDNLAKIKEYYHSLIDHDAAQEPNPIKVFIEECCSISQENKIERTPLYNSYVRWCISNNVYPKSKIKLTEYLSELDEVAYLSPDNKNGLNARFMGIELNSKGLQIVNW